MMGILRDALIFPAMKIIIAIAMCLVLICQAQAQTPMKREARSSSRSTSGMQVQLTILQGLQIGGVAKGILLSGTNASIAAFEIEVYVKGASDVTLTTSGNLRLHTCSRLEPPESPHIKLTRICGVHTSYSQAVIRLVQEVL